MGLSDMFSKVFGGGKSTATDSVKPPSQVLKENGIDPSNLKFTFHQDGAVGIAGHAGTQAECDRICELVKGIPGVSGVKNNIKVGAVEPAAEASAEEAVVENVKEAPGQKAGRTYTVKSGDTLWAIAEKMYGSGGKYMKIFEANTSILKNPDKIFPGQELVIPDLE